MEALEYTAVKPPVVEAERAELRSASTALGTRTGWPMRLTYFLSDLASILVALTIANAVSNFVREVPLGTLSALELKLYGLFTVGLLAAAKFQRTYAAIPQRPVRQFRGWVRGALAVCGVLVAAAWLLDVGTWTHYAPLILATAVGVVLASFNRAMCRVRFGHARWWGTRLIVVGNGSFAAQVFAKLDREPQWGLRPAAFVDDADLFDAADPSSLVDPLNRLDELAAALGVDRGLIATHSFAADDLANLLSRAGGRIRHWVILSPLDRFPSMWQDECEAARLPALAVTNRLALPWSLPAKRAFDIVLTVGMTPFLLPLIAITAMLVRLTTRGPIFYGQERIGRKGRRFTAWKFRTMHPNADAILHRWLAKHPELAAEWEANHKLKRDPRVTWIGGWLRSISLDELPQIWNVLVGDMSLVGPRPIVAAEIDKYADRYEDYVQVTPGITGLWQVSGRNNTTYEERVDLDAYYVQNWSLWLDLYILACTVKVVLLGDGAY